MLVAGRDTPVADPQGERVYREPPSALHWRVHGKRYMRAPADIGPVRMHGRVSRTIVRGQRQTIASHSERKRAEATKWDRLLLLLVRVAGRDQRRRWLPLGEGKPGCRPDTGDEQGSGRSDAESRFARSAGLTMGRRPRECCCSCIPAVKPELQALPAVPAVVRDQAALGPAPCLATTRSSSSHIARCSAAGLRSDSG